MHFYRTDKYQLLSLQGNVGTLNMTAFHRDTPGEVAVVLERARLSRTRIRVFYGDRETGKDWMEQYNTMGYVGRSTGKYKIPLCINNERSTGGSGFLDHCILKIVETKTKRVLYQAPNYETPSLTIGDPVFADLLGALGYVAGVYRGKENVANFKNLRKAETWVAFMQGDRMNWGK